MSAVSAAETLLQLAEEFAPAEPLQAIKCLEALLQAPSPPLPLLEVRARLRLAALLLEFSDNVEHAKEHLERAQVVVLPLPSCDELKCRVFGTLASCYAALRTKPKELKAALRKGHDLAVANRKKQAPGASALWASWALYFQLQLCAAHAHVSEHAPAAECARAARALAQDLGDTPAQVVCALCAAQLALKQGNDASALAALDECDALLGPPADGSAALRVHASVLRVLSSLRRGDNKAATPCAEALPALLQRAKNEGGFAYDWLATPTLAALVHLLSAVCDRAWSSKLPTARGSAEKALEITAGELLALGVTDAVAEPALSHRATRLARPLLLLRFAAIECATQVSLVQCDLARAAQQVSAARALVQRFPVLLADARGAALHLAGLHAHCMGEYAAAVAAFAAAEPLLPAPGSRALCGVQRALSLLCAGAPGCEGAALDALGALGRAPDDAPGFAERAGGLFASALAALRRGDALDAKARLSRALKVAHGELGNHELVSQVLGALGALVEAQGDAGQARDMLMSAFTLSKSAGDLNAQAGALRVLVRVHNATGASKEAGEMERYAAKKKTALATAISAARA